MIFEGGLMMLNKCLITVVAILTFFASQSALAVETDSEEFSWVKPVPTLEELTGGKFQAGQKITKDNMHLFKDNIPVAMEILLEDGAEWIVTPHTPSEKLVIPALVEATHRNAGKALVKPDGSVYSADGGPWYGGFPVPNPQTAIDVMANWLYRDVDNVEEIAYEYWTNPAGKSYKTIRAHRRELFMNGRVCIDNVRQEPGFEGELRREVLINEAPYDVKGISILTISYQDQSRLPDAWGYIPVLRRVQRFSTAQRDDSLDGSDLRGVNINLFSDPLGFWNWKLLERKPMLSSVTLDNPTVTEEDGQLPRIKGKYRIGGKLELRDTFVIEASPNSKAGDRIYSRILLYIDAASYHPWWATYYDNQGELWLVGNMTRKRDVSSCGNFSRITSFDYYNMQKGAALNIDFFYLKRNVGKDEVGTDMFNLRFLAAQGR